MGLQVSVNRMPQALEDLRKQAEDIDRLLYAEIAQRRWAPGEDLLAAVASDMDGTTRSATSS